MAQATKYPTTAIELTTSRHNDRVTSPLSPITSRTFAPKPSSCIQPTSSDSFPEGGTKAWLTVFGSFSLLVATFGVLTSIGIFQSYWQAHQLSAYTSRDIGWIASVLVFLTLFLAVQVGPLFDRHGPKWLLVGGSVAYVVCWVLLAECTVYWQFLLCLGVLGGICQAVLVTVAMSVTAHWFERRRGLATGVSMLGSSLGGIGFPFILRAGFENVGWAWTMRIMALITGLFCALGVLCIRGRLETGKQKGVISFEYFGDARFVWVTLGIACRWSTIYCWHSY